MMKAWYTIDNVGELDSPALLIYPERVRHNIAKLLERVSDVKRLRPHVKTNKCAEVARMLLDAGITQFKCATIAEAEMLAMLGAPDVLLAYQPWGPKVARLLQLIQQYPKTQFACLVDHALAAAALQEAARQTSIQLRVFIDLNIGMNRTGIAPASAMELANGIHAASHLVLAGLHAYDGHLRDPDLAKRTIECNEGFAPVEALSAAIEQAWGQPISVIAGGTPSFPIHAQRPHVVCSPGTFIFWDKGYQTILPEQPFEFAALVLARIVSIPNDETITADLGHKAVASENPLDKRVYFLNAPDLQPVGHSEEHLALRAPKGHAYRVGDVLYGVPHHVCPTVALHEYAAVINQHRWTDTWQIVSRKRKVTV